MKDINELFEKIHVKPKSLENYKLALTHPSYNADARTKHQDYERLEYIGDAVLGFVSADLIFNMYPDMDQGLMTKLRSNLVKSKSLANYARRIDLASYIVAGHSISPEKINESDKILEDVFESLIGAIYLDQGIKKAHSYIKSFIYNDIKHARLDELTDYKSKLQEEMQAEYRESVKYTIVSEKGPSHNKTFVASCTFNGLLLATGVGKSKKEAEENAAKAALEKGSV